MRRPFIAGNWKMNLNITEAKALISGLIPLVKGATNVDIAVCPVALAVPAAVEAAKGTNIKVGGQDLYWEKSGAFTGQISGDMLKSAGCEYVIIGHSERRQFFGETNETVNKKIKAAFLAGLKPIVCVGESLAEREGGKTFDVVKDHVVNSLANIKLPEFNVEDIVIAYEPVWAIGTGKTATKEQAQEVHAYIRKLLTELYGKDLADKLRIQYGGSVKADNIKELMAQPDIDGALVGGASLKADSFAGIVNF
ncbi:MAG: triose-phosphate isomerase [Candidatus Margulisiibacteriota bacterium]|jgi:triosephosphate isomerase